MEFAVVAAERVGREAAAGGLRGAHPASPVALTGDIGRSRILCDLSKTMRCSKCGTEGIPGKKFCAECGSPVAKRCPNCKADNAAVANFCTDCGTALSASGTVAQANPSPSSEGAIFAAEQQASEAVEGE